MKRLFLINTTRRYIDNIFIPFAIPFMEQNPDVEVYNIADDSLLSDTLRNGCMPNEVAARMMEYVFCAEKAGADVIMVTCTSVNEVAKHARRFARVPVFNIDEPMARQAVELGEKIGIVATVPTSAPATIRLLEEAAHEKGKRISVEKVIREEAYQALINKDRKLHDEMIREEIDKLADKVDVIALGQISLSLVRPECKKPVLQVGPSGFAEAKKLLFNT